MITFEKLQLVKEMIAQLAVFILLADSYFKEHYKLIATDLSKQQKLDADSKAIQLINFTGNRENNANLENNTTIFFIIEKVKETVLDFSNGTVKVLWFYLVLI